MDHKAKRIADSYIKDQDSLDKILAQFSPAHRSHVLERLRPHLTFEPKPLDPQYLLHLK